MDPGNSAKRISFHHPKMSNQQSYFCQKESMNPQETPKLWRHNALLFLLGSFHRFADIPATIDNSHNLKNSHISLEGPILVEPGIRIRIR